MSYIIVLMVAAPAFLLVMAIANWLGKPGSQGRPRWLGPALGVDMVVVAAAGLAFSEGNGLWLIALAPAGMGILALGLTIPWREAKYRFWRALGWLALTWLAVVTFNSFSPAVNVVGWMLVGSLTLVSAWLISRRGWGWAAALCLAGFGLWAIQIRDLSSLDFSALPVFMDPAVRAVMRFLYFLVPDWVVSLAGLLGLEFLLLVRPQAVLDGSASPTSQRWRAALPAALALGLLGWLFWDIYWATAWDKTSDGLYGVISWLNAAVVALGAGLFLGLLGRPEAVNWRWAYAAAFSFLTPALLYLAIGWGGMFDYHAATEQRAAHIALALEAYHTRQGSYPPSLGELPVSDLIPQGWLSVPQPFILHGETWCYQGWTDGYRLGALYRQHFSTPLEVRLYANQGDPPAEWDCPQRLEAYKTR